MNMEIFFLTMITIRHRQFSSISTFADKLYMSFASSHSLRLHWSRIWSGSTLSQLGYGLGNRDLGNLVDSVAGGAPIADLKHDETERERRDGL